MRPVFGAALLLLLVATTVSGQSITLQGSAGPTIGDSGYSAAAAIGFSPSSRLTVLFGLERTHLRGSSTSDGRGGISTFRGGTFSVAEAELQAALLPRDRVAPYVLGGVGVGVSRPNVNDTFPDPATNHVRMWFFGGGLAVPVGKRISVFGDARMMVGTEAGDLLAVVPVRIGLAWRF